MMCSSALSSGHLKCNWSNSLTVNSRLCGGPAGLLKAGLVFVHIKSVVVGNPPIMDGKIKTRSLIIANLLSGAQLHTQNPDTV